MRLQAEHVVFVRLKLLQLVLFNDVPLNLLISWTQDNMPKFQGGSVWIQPITLLWN